MLRHATDARRAEISAMPGGAEVVKLMATMMPRSYTVTGTTVSPDGGTALLRATGTGSFMGQSSQRHGAVNFLKEKGEWKVDRWEWSDKPGVTQSEPECEIKPVMSDEDLRRCGATPR